MNNSNQDRLDELQKYLGGRRRVTLEEIHQFFNVSIATARRDLDFLDQNGIVERISGGAIVIEQASPQLPIFNRKMDQPQEKAQIGLRTASIINDGETVFLGGGSTVLEVAKNLANHKNITVVTNSLLVINTLADRTNIKLVIIGGVFRAEEHTIYGHFAEQMLKEINADKVIFGARSINLSHGVTNDLTPDVSTDQALLQIGRELILVADHTKFNRLSTVSVCSLSQLNKIVTDKLTSPEIIKAIKEKGVEVIIVQ
jgi:DeoR/GlpR family transcriptional regulator of sugar metabolism